MPTNKQLVKTPCLKDQVAEILRTDIREKSFSNGMLPSIRDLAKRFDVSTMTISSALDVLASEKLIERVKGKGIYVKGAKSDRPWRSNGLQRRGRAVAMA